MYVYEIKTVGNTIKGTAIVLAESEESAKCLFDYKYKDEEILEVKEIEVDEEEKIIYYDDGDR